MWGVLVEKTLIDIEQAVAVLKLLGDRTRLTMVALLEDHECCVCELVEMFNMSQPAISQHMRKLKDVGLVRERRKGQWVFYALNKDHDTYPMIKDVLSYLPNQQEKLQALEANGLRIVCE